MQGVKVPGGGYKRSQADACEYTHKKHKQIHAKGSILTRPCEVASMIF